MDQPKTAEEKAHDEVIAATTLKLLPFDDGAAKILYRTLLQYHGVGYKVDQCRQMLSASTDLLNALVKAHHQKSYKDLAATAVLEEPKPNNTSTAAPPPPHPPSIPPQAIHVQPHSNPATTTPALHKIPFEAQAVINRVLKSLQNIIAPEWKWKSWIPQHLSKRAEDAEIYAWLSGLEIPELNGQPSLLLHGLGNLQNDPEMISRLSKIFLLSKVTSLVNTAGSGKTRHVLEGLCREWGFYICSTVETEAFGSKDLMDCIETCIPATPGFTAVLPDNSDPGFAESLARNRKIAADALFQVMLARTIIFREFLNAIVASGRKIVEDDKRRWVYIQIHPAVLGPSFDVFNELARVLNKHAISAVACRQIIRTLFDEQQAIISDHSENPVDKAGFHCVLDEAQFAANHLPLAFRSEDGLTRRSILREVIVVLSILLVGSRYGVEISGTGVDKQVVDMTMSSVIVKASRSTWTSLTGSFVKNESSGLQEKYIRQYLPPRLLKSVVGQRLIKRMGHWLEGRFRFTAAFLANLFMSDFGNPHQFLDDWVEYHTKFRPTDAPDLRSSPTPVTKHFSTAPLHTKIDFKRFHGQSIVTLTSAIYESLIRANYTGTLQGKAHQMVEAGFARYKPQDSNTSESDRAAISEPLILLASATILREQSTDPEVNDLWQYLVVQIGSNKSSVNNGFENYIAFLMADVFSKPTCLKDVFEFSETRPVPDWANQTARLVALHCDADSNGTQPAVHEVDWPNRAVPGGQFGYDYDTKNVAATTIGWLQHRYKVPFCFPPKAMGPDIISVLQLQNKKLLWVLIQCKYYSAALTSRDLDAAVESTAPLSWWVDASKPTSALTEPTNAALKALKGPNSSITTEPYPILRVVVAVPRVRMEDLDARAMDYGENSPLCTMNWDGIIQRIPSDNILGRLRTPLRPKRKRQQPQTGVADTSDSDTNPPVPKVPRTTSATRGRGTVSAGTAGTRSSVPATPWKKTWPTSTVGRASMSASTASSSRAASGNDAGRGKKAAARSVPTSRPQQPVAGPSRVPYQNEYRMFKIKKTPKSHPDVPTTNRVADDSRLASPAYSIGSYASPPPATPTSAFARSVAGTPPAFGSISRQTTPQGPRYEPYLRSSPARANTSSEAGPSRPANIRRERR